MSFVHRHVINFAVGFIVLPSTEFVEMHFKCQFSRRIMSCVLSDMNKPLLNSVDQLLFRDVFYTAAQYILFFVVVTCRKCLFWRHWLTLLSFKVFDC